ncbi:MAG: hypothetical protein JWR08_1513 [Enterovirga sp.]|nr:hypothetical protein [Enterovirga sp.]
MTGEDERQPPGLSAPVIAVECLSCGRTAELPASEVLEQPLVRLTRRFRCSECGSRAVKATRIAKPQDVAKLIRSRMSARGE